MKRTAPFAFAAALAVALAAAAPARAETTAASVIAQFKVNEPTDPAHKLHHGAIWLDYDKAQNTYRWGGKQCGNQELSPQSVQMLFDAFRSGMSVILEFKRLSFQQKPFRCITAFTITK